MLAPKPGEELVNFERRTDLWLMPEFQKMQSLPMILGQLTFIGSGMLLGYRLVAPWVARGPHYPRTVFGDFGLTGRWCSPHRWVR